MAEPETRCPECVSLGLRPARPKEDGARGGTYACATCGWTGYHLPEEGLPPATLEARRRRAAERAEQRAAGRLHFLRLHLDCGGDACEEAFPAVEGAVGSLLGDLVLDGREGTGHHLYFELTARPSENACAALRALPFVAAVELR